MPEELSFDTAPRCNASSIRMLLENAGVMPAELAADISQIEEPLRNTLEQIPFQAPPKVRPNGVVLAGTTGVGKTYAMAALAKHQLLKKYAYGIPNQFDPANSPAIWRSVLDLVTEWRSMALHPADQERLFRRLAQADFLFLDDLGGEIKERGGREYDRGIAFIDRLIRARYDHYRSTSCTTNCTAEALIMRYGAPFFSRLQHMSMWIEFPRGSRDRRLRGKP
ncbi:hypothetical protein [Geothrix sp.]|jgi:DNA replication protein DnaC|uniref:hypothetical protein n=1 Tax=Geothrix sp. TaxID=1962974 RepID=UPI0025BAF9DD|nr:hypothetical protein [Geothrix sp.]